MTPCSNCGNVEYVAKRSWIEGGEMHDMCDGCGSFSVLTVPDVFFKTAYKSQALNVEFTSKAQKAAYLKANDLREAGDEKMSTKTWVEGSRPYRKKQFDREERPKLRQIIREWRNRQ